MHVFLQWFQFLKLYFAKAQVQSQYLAMGNLNKSKEIKPTTSIYSYYPQYSVIKDRNADLTVGNWNSKKDP